MKSGVILTMLACLTMFGCSAGDECQQSARELERMAAELGQDAGSHQDREDYIEACRRDRGID